MSKKIEWGKEIVQAGNDVAELAKDVGIPGLSLLARFAQSFYEKHLQRRFERFIADAGIDQGFIDRVLSEETYADCLYAILETVRQTHSRVGVIALALIYRDHWNDEPYLISALRAFTQINDRTIDAFIALFRQHPARQRPLDLGRRTR